MDGMTFEEAMETWQSLPQALQLAFIIVGVALVVCTIVAIVVSIYLAIKYRKFNKMDASCGKTGGEIARSILDAQGLQNIKVTKSGSLLLGNSYSHFFKKVRLRKRTIDKASLTSVGMGAEKAALAVLDKQGDKDMKRRIWATPVMTLSPLLFIPLIIVGAVFDVVTNNTSSSGTIIASLVAIICYAIAFYLMFRTLVSEKKAQDMSCNLLLQQGLATSQEITYLRELFRLYNIEYVNNMIMALLEILWYVLEIIATVYSKK